MMAESPTDETDDPVVQEINVYLTKNLLKNLYLFQYPVRPLNSPYDTDQFLQARVKPQQQKIEIEVGVDTKSQNYDTGKGEQIVLNATHGDQENSFFNGKLMNKQVLSSIKSSTNVDRYAIGLFRPGELHLTPVHGIVQMRPTVSYLDLSDARLEKLNKGQMEDEEEEEIKAVTVKFAGPQTEKAKLAKEKSFWYKQQKMKNEPWLKMNIHYNHSARSSLENSRLFCNKMDHDASELPCSAPDYLDRLVSFDDPEFPEENLDKISNKDIPIADHVKAILLSAKILRFSDLQDLIPVSDSSILLRALQPLALLVRGCWVVKSEIQYPKDTFSPLTRVPADTLCKVRDYVIWKFSEEPFLSRNNLPQSLKLPDDDWTSILSEIAKYNPVERGWTFKYPIDQEFIDTYIEVVERQKLLWTARSQQMIKLIPKKQ